MLQKEVFPNYRKDCADLAKIYEILKSLYNDTYVDELCTMRGYIGDEQKALIRQMKLGYCSIEDVDVLGDRAKDLGFITKKGNFLLDGRFIIPVEDIHS